MIDKPPSERWKKKRTDQAAQVVYALSNHAGDGPMTAIELAAGLGITGQHEGVRRTIRTIRTIIKYAREKLGYRICGCDGAPKDCGYWMARNAQEWASYQDAQKKRVAFRFVSMRRQREAATDRLGGQKKLFNTMPVTAGF